MSVASSITQSPNNIAVRRKRSKKIGCRTLPHGIYPIMPMMLSLIGWIASVSEDGCDYARVTGSIVKSLTGSSDVPFLEFGFNAYRKPMYDPNTVTWSTHTYQKCLEYDDTLVPRDKYWNIGEALAFFSLVLGGGGAVFLCLSTCMVFSPATWRWTGYLIMSAAIFQGLSFVWFHTSVCSVAYEDGRKRNSCTLLYGSYSDIAAACCWFVSGIFILLKYPVPQKKNESRQSRNNKNPNNNSPTHNSNKSPTAKKQQQQQLELPIVGLQTNMSEKETEGSFILEQKQVDMPHIV